MNNEGMDPELEGSGTEEQRDGPQGRAAVEQNAEKSQEEAQKKQRKPWGVVLEEILLPIMIVLGVAVALLTGIAVTGSILLSRQAADPATAAAPSSDPAPEVSWATGESKSTFSVFKEMGLLSGYPTSAAGMPASVQGASEQQQ